MARAKPAPVPHHRCPPFCHHCPEIQEATDGEDSFMPFCAGGVMSGLDGCHCANADFHLAELVRLRDYLRRELTDIERRIRVAETAAHKALVALGPRKVS